MNNVAQPRPVPVQAGVVNLGPINSRIDFVGTHEGPKPDPRKGGFSKFAGRAEFAQNGALAAVEFDIETSSLWTEIPKLTGHLKSPDFFDVRQYPRAAFRSSAVSPTQQQGVYNVSGKFTLLGVTKEVSMPQAARVTDPHTCPMMTGPVRHVGGPIMGPGAPTVIICGLPAARVSDMAQCVGLPDTITITPPTRWTQVASTTGAIVNVVNIPAGLGGSQSTYYKDDSTVDSNDTGDQRSYGDAGFQVNNPNPGRERSGSSKPGSTQ